MSRFNVFFILAVALACLAASDGPRYAPWSAPVNVDEYNQSLDPDAPPVNWPAKTDQTPRLSRDGLSLYFSSGRSGASMDIYVSQRAAIGAPWGAAVNLGAAINDSSPAVSEMTPVLSPDGHRLYFSSNRAGGFGDFDIYVSRRQDSRDDFGWEPAENLGPVVNSGGREQLANFFEDEATGTVTAYLSRIGGPTGADIYASTLLPDGHLTAPSPVEELNTEFNDQFPTIRRDGLEVIFASDRPGSIDGSLDLWVSTRSSAAEPWSMPALLAGVNTNTIENHPALSFDGTELYFTSTREGGPAPQELYVAVRIKPKGQPQ